MKVKCKLCDYSLDLEERVEQAREGLESDPEMREAFEDMMAVAKEHVDTGELISEIREEMPRMMLRSVMVNHLEEEHSKLWQNFLRSNFEISR